MEKGERQILDSKDGFEEYDLASQPHSSLGGSGPVGFPVAINTYSISNARLLS